MDRLPQRLAPQIPQRDVDRADRLDIGALAAEIAGERIELLPGLRWLVGASAKEKRRQHVVDARSHGTGRAVLAAFAPTDETIVGLDLDQQAVALRKSRLGGIEGLLRNGGAKDVGRYSADDHRAIPLASASRGERQNDILPPCAVKETRKRRRETCLAQCRGLADRNARRPCEGAS